MKIGFACLSTATKIRTNRTTTLAYLNRTFNDNDAAKIEYIKDKARQNLAGMIQMLEHCRKSGILAYRIPDNFLPFIDKFDYLDDFRPQLEYIGSLANKYNIHLSWHPGQYFVLNSPTQRVVDNTVTSLNAFADVLDAMRLDYTPILLLHVGHSHNKNYTLGAETFVKNYWLLNENARRMLAIENDQTNYTIEYCIAIANHLIIPVVFDIAHWKYNRTTRPLHEVLGMCAKVNANHTFKIHISSEREPSGRHAHSDYIDPVDLDELLDALPHDDVIIMCEAKQKDLAAMRVKQHIVAKKSKI